MEDTISQIVLGAAFGGGLTLLLTLPIWIWLLKNRPPPIDKSRKKSQTVVERE